MGAQKEAADRKRAHKSDEKAAPLMGMAWQTLPCAYVPQWWQLRRRHPRSKRGRRPTRSQNRAFLLVQCKVPRCCYHRFACMASHVQQRHAMTSCSRVIPEALDTHARMQRRFGNKEHRELALWFQVALLSISEHLRIPKWVRLSAACCPDRMCHVRSKVEAAVTSQQRTKFALKCTFLRDARRSASHDYTFDCML